MENAPSSRNRTAWLAVIILVVVTPLLYFASVGPVYWLCEHDWIHPDWIMAFFPMIWLAERVPVLNGLLVVYLELWQW
jgi:hypothetical protein